MLHVTPLGLGKVFSVSRKETTGSLSGVPILDRSYVDFGFPGYDNESADDFSKLFKNLFLYFNCLTGDRYRFLRLIADYYDINWEKIPDLWNQMKEE